jgi:hypothetical protein
MDVRILGGEDGDVTRNDGGIAEVVRTSPPLNRIFTLSSPRKSHVQASAGPVAEHALRCR